MADITSGRARRMFSVGHQVRRAVTKARDHRVFRTPGHRVFLLRAMIGLDAYLRALGSVHNWHRLFREIVEAVPPTNGSGG